MIGGVEDNWTLLEGFRTRRQIWNGFMKRGVWDKRS